MTTTVTFKVSFELPEYASLQEAQRYVREAVSTMHGCLKPALADMGDGTFEEGDPMWGLNSDTVVVKEIRS